jgi:hypothetical protein
MPSRDSLVPEKVASETEVEDSEEIVTPIEAGAQAQAEREFETERKIPVTCNKAIVSVNGKDVDEVPMPRHDRAA